MKIRIVKVAYAFILTASLAAVAAAQTTADGASGARGPSSPARSFVVMTAKSLAEVERKLYPAANWGEVLTEGEGMELRVVV